MALTPGLALSDRYRLTYLIAIGGMGEVWAADDTRLARGVAIKILKSELSSDPEFVDRFRAEARVTASLNHSGVAAVYDYGEVASTIGGPLDTAFLVMELVVGEPLSAVLVRTPRLSVPRTLDLLEQSGRALQAAHARSLVHRDIKPGNILITPTGQVKITDFGIAKVAHQVPVTRGGLVMGTAQYLSPEQAAGQESHPPSDVYALGIVAYECLAGIRPFNGENAVAVAIAHVHDEPPPLPPDVPPPVAALVMRMLAKDPNRRFPDGAAVARAVVEVRGGGRPGFGPVTGATAVPPGFDRPRLPTSRGSTNGVPATGRPGGGPTGRPGGGPTGRSGGVPTGLPSGPNSGAVAPRGAMLPGRSVGGYSADGYAPPAYAPPMRQPGPSMARMQAGQPAPVNRRTGVAALIAVLVLLIVGIAGAILLTHAGTLSSSRDPSAIGAHSTVTGNFAAGGASYSWWA